MVPSLLDTNAISDIIRAPAKRHASVAAHALAYLQAYGRFSFSELSCYEILRGLRKKGATRQLAHFDGFCQPADRKPVSMEILDSAASLWVESQRKGRIVDDCDLIIAAIAWPASGLPQNSRPTGYRNFSLRDPHCAPARSRLRKKSGGGGLRVPHRKP